MSELPRFVPELFPVQFVPTDEWRRKLVVSGGPLGDDHFCMENFHFHWGSMDAQGSEHTVNRRRFPMEMHLVHRNMRYARCELKKKKKNQKKQMLATCTSALFFSACLKHWTSPTA